MLISFGGSKIVVDNNNKKTFIEKYEREKEI